MCFLLIGLKSTVQQFQAHNSSMRYRSWQKSTEEIKVSTGKASLYHFNAIRTRRCAQESVHIGQLSGQSGQSLPAM